MILPEKVARLKASGLQAVRMAMLWEEKIAVSGVKSAEDLYLSLGHNHLERKSTVEWEGLTLSREPTELEKLCIKSISQAQDAGKESLAKILLKARTALIDDAQEAIKKLKPANFHKLILSVPDDLQTELRDQLSAVFQKGRELVASELSKQKQQRPRTGEPKKLDALSGLTASRIANEVQARIAAAAARYELLGLEDEELWAAVMSEMDAGSISYIDRAAAGAANAVLNMGRSAEMFDRRDDIDRYEYSAILDNNTCGPCAADDGKTASSPDDLPDTPNPDCAGSDYCRCFIVAIMDTTA